MNDQQEIAKPSKEKDNTERAQKELTSAIHSSSNAKKKVQEEIRGYFNVDQPTKVGSQEDDKEKRLVSPYPNIRLPEKSWELAKAGKQSKMESMFELSGGKAAEQVLDMEGNSTEQAAPNGPPTKSMPGGMPQGNIAVPYKDLCVMTRDTYNFAGSEKSITQRSKQSNLELGMFHLRLVHTGIKSPSDVAARLLVRVLKTVTNMNLQPTALKVHQYGQEKDLTECTEDIYLSGNVWNDMFLTTVYNNDGTAVAMEFRVLSTFNISLLMSTLTDNFDDISTGYESFSTLTPFNRK